jgi:ATPase subunit of ABC transporter with duplicated ATPase domains
LKLKSGVHYALIGRNGTGKSTILKAVAEKLIPGIPIETRISILQQTLSTDEDAAENSGKEAKGASQLSVLEKVIDRAISKSEIQREVDGTLFFSRSCGLANQCQFFWRQLTVLMIRWHH